ncbi:MAG: hypothetical protein HYW26_04200 [Candidatus Aenigmarchaeota archaeon]|nr:hypothetical protein [Candidatus Aenigmarchaeota archaeon]
MNEEILRAVAPSKIGERMVSWNEVHEMSENLARTIKKDFRPDVVISIASGGLVPGKLLKEMLGVKVMGVISAHYYEKNGNKRKECLVEKVLSGFVPRHTDLNILLVDDIADTGTTFREVLKALPDLLGHGEWSIKTASLLMKPHSAFVPDYYALEAEDWIVFPWEIGEVSV